MTDATASTVKALLPIATAFGGYISAELSGWLREGRAHKREREARKAGREDKKYERRNEFQRQTLLELQDAVTELVETTIEVGIRQLGSHGEMGGLVNEPFPNGLDRRVLVANAQTTKFGVRASDEQVRRLLEKLKSTTSACAFPQTKAKSDSARAEMLTNFDALNERIGELLRQLDDAEQST